MADHLRLGRHLNPGWDDELARRRVEKLGLDPRRKAGRLSGGQRAQLALTLGVAKRPQLLVLDEPVAPLDPFARREFLQGLMEAAVEEELSVLLSSHLVSDLERTCDYLVLLDRGTVRLAAPLDEVMASHRRLTGPRTDPSRLPQDQHVVSASHTDRQSTYVVRTDHPIHDPAWSVERARPRGSRACLSHAGQQRPGSGAGGAAMTWLAWRQFRAQAVTAVIGLVLLGGWLLATGPGLADQYAQGRAGCGSSGCDQFMDGFLDQHQGALLALTAAVLLVPALLGMFWGAPLVARELDAGTHRLAWNQSVTRYRWLSVKLVLVGSRPLRSPGWWSGPSTGGPRRWTPPPR